MSDPDGDGTAARSPSGAADGGDPASGSAAATRHDSDRPEREHADVPEPPEAPAAPDAADGADVTRDVAVAFWRVTIAVNAAVLALSLGPMLAYFRGQYELGATLVAAGVVALGYAYLRYRLFMAGRGDGSGPESSGNGDDSAGESQGSEDDSGSERSGSAD